jgi:HlyD family secretion protein
MEAIVFVPAGVGKKIRLGDVVQVEPDTVKRQEHGYIRGVVRSASEIPATEMAMLAELKHTSLVSSFVEQYAGQVLLCVHVELLRARAPSAGAGRVPVNGLEWSSSSGAFQRVSNGTLCAAEVVVEKRPLITLAMPWVKHLMGVD